MSPKIVVMESHEDLFLYWQKSGLRDISLVHLDAHCDMYGLLINRPKKYCVEIKPRRLDEGNFLLYAIKHGMIRSIKWVHDEYGGRRYDPAIVKYENDLTTRLKLLNLRFRNAIKYPIDYETIEFDGWKGPLPGEHLDIDWDFFALDIKNRNTIKHGYERFLRLNWEVMPDFTYIAYSHKHIHPSRSYFDDFVERLSKKFGVGVELFLPEKTASAGERPSPRFRRMLRRMRPLADRVTLLMHRHGIY